MACFWWRSPPWAAICSLDAPATALLLQHLELQPEPPLGWCGIRFIDDAIQQVGLQGGLERVWLRAGGGDVLLGSPRTCVCVCVCVRRGDEWGMVKGGGLCVQGRHGACQDCQPTLLTSAAAGHACAPLGLPLLPASCAAPGGLGAWLLEARSLHATCRQRIVQHPACGCSRCPEFEHLCPSHHLHAHHLHALPLTPPPPTPPFTCATTTYTPKPASQQRCLEGLQTTCCSPRVHAGM